MSEEPKTEFSEERLRQLDAAQRRQAIEWAYDKIDFQKLPDIPSFFERAATRTDNATVPALRAWLRLCLAVGSAGIVYKFIFWSDTIAIIVGFIELAISSGRGFTIPTVVLITLLPQLVERLASLKE